MGNAIRERATKPATGTRMLLAACAVLLALAAPAAARPEGATAPETAATEAAEGETKGRVGAGKTSSAPAAGGEERPWARGVSKDARRRALALYSAGNRALKDLQFATAAARYREALAHWDHPGIHYNLAIALIGLERPLEAYRSVLAALRYGGAALHDHERLQALEYKSRLQQRVATLAVTCTEPGATVLLDGEPLLTGTGQAERLVLVGEHQVVVRKPGHLARTESLALQPGTRTAVAIEERRELLARWIPWTIVGAGVAVGGLGAGLHWRASVDMARFDEEFGKQCGTGCSDLPLDNPRDSKVQETPKRLTALRRRARWEQYAAVGAYTASAGLVITGLVLAWVNPERSFRLGARRVPGEPMVTPLVLSNGAGMTLDITF